MFEVNNSLVLFEEYLVHEKQASESTVKNYMCDLRNIFGDSLKKSDEANLAHFLLLYVMEQKDNCSIATLNRKVATLNTFVRYLSQYGFIERDFSPLLRKLVKNKMN